MFCFYFKVYGNRFYGQAQNLNIKLTKAYDEALKTYDVIIMPTLPYKAPLLPTNDSSMQGLLNKLIISNLTKDLKNNKSNKKQLNKKTP